jgi:hypothetical protein
MTSKVEHDAEEQMTHINEKLWVFTTTGVTTQTTAT